jgi:peptidoglycan/xylan/chitin deacetylase (PgdA/CDA1 family)
VQVVELEHILDVPADRDALALTFDDALASLADVAWPLLREHGLPATVFVPTGRVGRDNDWGDAPQEDVPTLALCDWDSLERMNAEGLSVGSHSVSHARLDGLDDGALRAELEDSAAEIERRLGTRPTAFAYPYGECDERVARLTAERYRLTVTTDLRVLGPLPRGEPLLERAVRRVVAAQQARRTRAEAELLDRGGRRAAHARVVAQAEVVVAREVDALRPGDGPPLRLRVQPRERFPDAT